MTDDLNLKTIRDMRGRIISALQALGVRYDANANAIVLLDELITEAAALNDAHARHTLAAADDHVTRIATTAANVAVFTALETAAVEARAWLAKQRAQWDQ